MQSIGSELRKLGYTFSAQGILVSAKTGEKFEFQNQDHYDEVSVATQEFIADSLVSKYGCQSIFLPLSGTLQKAVVAGPMLPPSPPFSRIYLSEDALRNQDRLLLVIQGSGQVR